MIRDHFTNRMKNPKIFSGTKGNNQIVCKRCFQLTIRKEKLWLFKAIYLYTRKKNIKMADSRLSFDILYFSSKILLSLIFLKAAYIMQVNKSIWIL